MPRGDGSGPSGVGPMTGRGAGFCAGYDTAGNARGSLRCGMGFGRARGFRHMFYSTGMTGVQRSGYRPNIAVKDEESLLSSQVEFLESRLQQLKEQLNGLDKKTE